MLIILFTDLPVSFHNSRFFACLLSFLIPIVSTCQISIDVTVYVYFISELYASNQLHVELLHSAPWEILSCFDLTGADFKCQMQKYNQILYDIMSVWFSVNPPHRSKSNITIAATALDHHHHNVRMKVQKMWVLHLPRRTV